jgi:hypothetical protein
MALIKTSIKLIIKEHNSYGFSGPVLALGVLEIYATYTELNAWFQEFTGRSCPVASCQVNITTNTDGQKLKWVAADTFFKAFNFSEVVTLDVPQCEHPPDIVHNLNEPFPSNLINRFGLIIDPGTIEHVFDMKTCLANIVLALKMHGVIIHQVPVYSYNGGYYSINPSVLYDFYGLNGFSQIKSYLILWDRYRPYTGQYRCYKYSPELLGGRHSLADRDQCRFVPHILFFARKSTDVQIIKPPTQDSSCVKNRGWFAEKALMKINDLLFRVLPFHWATYISQKAQREIWLRKIHRQEFWA